MGKRPHYHEPRYHGHRRTKYRSSRGSSVGSVIAGASIFGAVLAGGAILSSPEQRAAALDVARDVGVKSGIVRARAPQDGDYWRGCDDARAAGTAPVYRGEPGYREGMDGDNDGIACEPYR
ncbi:excalibur calcium-binding domain-containing protein [Sphingopyxis sp. USTB-05]|nr:excalibur calcium-binding domain-containing protein [Sphingopyxis sp. USTB-05]USI79087.1 excalibur calcium-binding domain-containing protein [Sphingopyxis sp. USTB-05]